MTVKDQLNRNIEVNLPIKRIVSLVPSITELIIDIGLEEQLVGCTKFCVHPNHIRKTKTIVGGTKSVKYEKIKNLNPDVILCNKEENTKEMIEVLETIAPVHVSDINSLEDGFNLIGMYGELFNISVQTDQLIHKIKEERFKFQETLKKHPKYSVAYFIWKDPWMVAGNNTFINEMILEAGFHNVFEQEERYPEVKLDHELLKQVDCIFLSTEPYPFKVMHLEQLKAKFPDIEVKLVDGEMFSWYGSRLIQSYQYFEELK